MSILLLGHGNVTQKVFKSLRGDIAATTKFLELLAETRYKIQQVDILELFGEDIHKLYEPLAALNYTLVESGHEIIEEFHLQEIQAIQKKILDCQPEYVLILSWLLSFMALIGTGIHKKSPTICKLYVLHEEDEVHAGYYDKCDLLITESLLSNKKAIRAGFPPWKTLLLPHYFSPTALSHPPSRSYVEKLIAHSGKKVAFTKNSLILGSVTRVDAGKNCEYTLEAVKKLVEQGHELLFILKGAIETFSSFPPYVVWLTKLLQNLEKEPWFLWDPTPSSLSEMGEIYAAFDIFIHLSGSEGGSNVIVESLSMGIPTLILEATTNPSLFQKGACFVKNAGFSDDAFPYRFSLPDKADLLQKLEALILSPSLRKAWGETGKNIAAQRFSKEEALRRVPLMLKAAHCYHYQSPQDGIKKELEALYYKDCELFHY